MPHPQTGDRPLIGLFIIPADLQTVLSVYPVANETTTQIADDAAIRREGEQPTRLLAKV
jgi:hypothetical protein